MTPDYTWDENITLGSQFSLIEEANRCRNSSCATTLCNQTCHAIICMHNQKHFKICHCPIDLLDYHFLRLSDMCLSWEKVLDDATLDFTADEADSV